MQDLLTFRPTSAGAEVDVTSTAATVTVRTGNADNTGQRIRFVNHGAAKCRIRFATLSDPNTWTQTAVTDTTGLVLLPGVIEEFDLNGAPSFSVKTESGTTDLNYVLGVGV